MREIDTFLEEYKKLETAIRNETGSTVLDYENTMQQDLAEKIKVCRIMRNYAQHNADYVRFLAATADMCDFLRNMTKDVEKDRLRAGDKCKKLQALTLKMSLKDIVQAFAKTKSEWLCIVDQDNLPYGIYTREMLVAGLATAGRLTSSLSSVYDEKASKKALKQVFIVKKETKLDEYKPWDKLLVCNEKTGKYEGIIIW